MSVVLGAEIGDFQRKMAAAKKELGGLVKFGAGLQDIGKNLSVGLSAPLLLAATGAVKLAGDMEKASVNFEVMLGSATKAREVLGDLKKFADSTPFEFPEVQQAAKKLLAFNTPASELKSSLRALGDIAAGIDAPIGEIAEIYGKARVQGRLFQEDINQLTGRGIPIIQELAKQFGVSDSEVRKLVETGKVGFPNIQRAFADLTGEGGKFSGLMEKQSRTLPGLISTALDTVSGFATDIGAEIVEQFNLKGALSAFSSFIGGLREQFEGFSPTAKKAILVIGGVATAIGPLLFSIGSVLKVLPLLKVGLAGIEVAFGAISLPVLAVGAAVAGAAFLIYKNWDEIRAYFTTGPGGKVFDKLAAAAKEAFAALTGIFDAGVGLMRAYWERFGPYLTEVASTAFGLLKTIFVGGFTLLADVFTVFARLFTGDWAGMWKGLQVLGADALNVINDLLTGAVSGLLRISGKLAGAFGFERISSGLASAAGSVTAFGEKLRLAVPEAQALKTQTSALGESATETTAALTTATTAVRGLSEEQTKALASLAEALRDNERMSTALGIGYDYVGGRAKALEAGIQSLIKAGFDPLGRTVQARVAELAGLATAYEQLETKLSKGIAAPKVDDNPVAFEVAKLPALPALEFDPRFAQAATEAAQQYSDALASLTPAQLQALDGQAQFNTDMEGLLDSMGGAFTDLGVTVGAAFGQVIAGTLSIGDAMRSALGGALGVLADFLKEYAKKVIALGIANLAINPVKGALQIAGGVALAAAAGAAGGIGSSLGSRSSSSATPTAAAGYTPKPADIKAQRLELTVKFEPVEFRQDGPALRGVLNVDSYRSKRFA